MLPIRDLYTRDRQLIAQHLLQLSQEDRYLRFGYAATDDQIGAYAVGIDFSRDDLFGVFNRRLQLVAMAHLALPQAGSEVGTAEFGVSVAQSVRNRGFGRQLFERAMVAARNHDVRTLIVHALSENRPMLHLAASAGARVVRDGMDSEARLELPRATVDSRMSEAFLRQFAYVDFRMKAYARRIWAMRSAVGLDGITTGAGIH